MSERKAEILLVEDNAADVRLAEEIFAEGGLSFNMQVARDGTEALAMLRREGEHADLIMPDFILLDLNLPRKDGREVLAEIKADPELMSIPVVVLTTSQNEEDIAHSYALHVNCYITKSRNLSQLFKIVKGIEEFWLGIVTLPLV